MPWRTDDEFRKAAQILAYASRERLYPAVLVTSARRGEGVTTATLLIGRQLRAAFGLRPLAVELDRTSPSFASLLGLDPNKTVQSVGAGETPLCKAVQTDASGLSVLVSTTSPYPEGVAAALRRVLDGARDEGYDMVLIDTPPVLEQADFVDAGSAVPRAILVVEAGATTDEMLDRVKRRFEQQGIGIVGAVLNKERRYMPNWLYRLLAKERG
jgi:tyrosine-protein kinase Etk/Wzc